MDNEQPLFLLGNDILHDHMGFHYNGMSYVDQKLYLHLLDKLRHITLTEGC